MNGGDLNQQQQQQQQQQMMQQQQWAAMQQYQQQWMAMQYPAMAVQQHMIYNQHYVPYYQHPHQQQQQQTPPPPPQQKQNNPIQSSSEDNKTIWIGDLQQWMDDGYLQSCFSQAGEVVTVKIIRNKQTGHSERYGFIEFDSHASAEKVLQTYNGNMMPNTEQPFRLNWAAFSTGDRRPEIGSDLSIFVGDLATDVTDALLHDTFASRYPSVKSAKVVVDPNSGRSKGYGFVRFGDENERSRAMTEMNGAFCSSRPMRVSVATPKKTLPQQQFASQAVVLAGGFANGVVPQGQSENDSSNTTIFVGGLDSDVTDEELRQAFTPFGEVISVKIPVGKGCGFVQFANRSNAEEAIQRLSGAVIGKQTVRLSWGRNMGNKQHFRGDHHNNQWNGAYYGRQGYNGYGYAAAGAAYGASSNGHGYYNGKGFEPIGKLIRARLSKSSVNSVTEDVSREYSSVYVGPQVALKEADKILMLPGQPKVNFNHYSGYVTVDPNPGRALFYYFAESEYASSKPLVLWLNGGPGCSSMAGGAMTELGPFRVNPDGKTLWHNEYSWNSLANVLFLESPAGVGFSYSNTTVEYGDKNTAADSYTFLVNWLERFPEYKTRDFYITGESYAGHYVPQLASLILKNNKITNQTVINLKGIAIGNAEIDFEDELSGMYDYFWTHALISDEHHEAIIKNCDFSSSASVSSACNSVLDQADAARGTIYYYDIYAPLCPSSPNSSSVSGFDPCSGDYAFTYLNTPEVQKAFHANVTGIPGPWNSCNGTIFSYWKDRPDTILPTIKQLMASGIRVWIYSGDTDQRVPVTSTRYSMVKLGSPVLTPWYPWYSEGEVGGYAVEYQNVTFVSIRGAGHFVPSYQPERAFKMFSSFLEGKLPPPYVEFYGGRGYDPLGKLLKTRKKRKSPNHLTEDALTEYSPVYIASQDGMKEADQIVMLTGQPTVNFDQYSGYVTVDPTAGRTLFYYFTEAEDSASKPLVLLLNGGPGCSSIGYGAMTELEPCRDYVTGDKRTTADSYTFLVNWFERFPEYKTRDFYLTGESYAGYYVPQLVDLIQRNNKITNQTVIKLKGIAQSSYDPCSDDYVFAYLNTPEVQKALHTNITAVAGPWEDCNFEVNGNWQDEPDTVLPDIKKLMASGINVWIYSEDTDGIIPVTATRYLMTKLGAPMKMPWYPWYSQGEVGGYVVGYENVTFVTIRGAGHFVPNYQPERAFAFFSSFLEGKFPPGEN
ncbi:hypothetical protein BUALT_Bualt15G0034700 [Buddleja alternifolia]|uniref:Carboxypeptidase n=1 Tax=Buddleja alternifolia TaxID=168488 RepID=A0AAV6WN36_9LAMI|nr:hypothetical protein BUALT_Bualt15G0034700 [Buddleja alternifolia]